MVFDKDGQFRSPCSFIPQGRGGRQTRSTIHYVSVWKPQEHSRHSAAIDPAQPDKFGNAKTLYLPYLSLDN